MKSYRMLIYPALILLTAALFARQWWRQPASTGDSLEAWLGRVNDPDAKVRAKAALELGDLGRNSDEAWNAVAGMALHESDPDARETALQSLKALCQANVPKDDPQRIRRKRTTIRTLFDGLKDTDSAVRARAPAALFEAGGMRFYGRPIHRSLDDVIDEESRPQIVRALVAALGDENEEVRAQADLYLEQCGPAIIPVLREGLKTEPERVHDYLRRCLQALGGDKST